MSSGTDYEGNREAAFDMFRKAMEALQSADSAANLAALKVLHKPEDARDPERAGERVRARWRQCRRVPPQPASNS